MVNGTAGYMVVAHKILVSAQGPLVLVLRLRVWGQGLKNVEFYLSVIFRLEIEETGDACCA